MKKTALLAFLLLLTACDSDPASDQPISGSWEGVIYDSPTFQNRVSFTIYNGNLGDAQSIIGGHELKNKADGRILFETLRGTVVGDDSFFDMHLQVGIDQNNAWVYTGYVDTDGKLCILRDLLREYVCLEVK
jgi:hypothetical protein